MLCVWSVYCCIQILCVWKRFFELCVCSIFWFSFCEYLCNIVSKNPANEVPSVCVCDDYSSHVLFKFIDFGKVSLSVCLWWFAEENRKEREGRENALFLSPLKFFFYYFHSESDAQLPKRRRRFDFIFFFLSLEQTRKKKKTEEMQLCLLIFFFLNCYFYFLTHLNSSSARPRESSCYTHHPLHLLFLLHLRQ